MKKTYRIYKLENDKTNDRVFMFYLPEEDTDATVILKRKAKRLNELRDLKKKGYVITADVRADKEEYLNARLSVVVSDYCKLDKDERHIRIFKHRYTPEVYCQTLELIVESKRTAMKRIVSLVRRLWNDDLDIHNEVALMLYDQYIKSIL